MEPHYNAFISYRHHPDDIRVAGEIHRCLERFKVPRAIRKKSNHITRLFRDKEELPITSNLTDDIASALRNSDYLIVICSVHTRESIWVQREIELFLQTHPRNKILTVLASGEPYEVIPEILLQEEVLDPATGEASLVPVEPLSCDWRLSRKKARQEELPRLAAALLSCGYDELRQRQRQHRIRKMIAAFSACLAVSVGLAAYFLYTSITIRNANIQIQKNLEESLRNQSQYLATAARDQLTDGDRLTAIALAVSALPSEENDRPYVPEAEYVLAQALGVYNGDSLLSAVGAVSPGNNILINSFWVSEDGKYLYLLDQRNCLTFWDTVTLEKLATLDLGNFSPRSLLTIGDGNIVLQGGLGNAILSAYRPDGSCMWELSSCYSIAMLSDGSTLLMITQDAPGENVQLHFIDPATGEPTREPIPLPMEEDPYFSPSFLQERYEPDLPIALQYHDGDAYSFLLVDPQTGACVRTVAQVSYPIASTLTPSGKLLVAVYDEDAPFSGVFGNTRINCPINDKVCCFDITDGRLLWTTPVTFYTDIGQTGLAPILSQSQVLFYNGSAFLILDPETGEILSRCEAGSNILSVNVGEQSAVAALQDGYICVYNYDENYCFETKCMEQDLSQAAICGAYFGHQSLGTQVSIYRSIEPENAWRYDFQESIYVSDLQLFENLMAFTNIDTAYIFDTVKKEIVLQLDKRLIQNLGFSQDGQRLYYQEEYGMLSFTDIATGKTSAWEIPTGDETAYYITHGDFLLNRDRLLYMLRGLDTPLLACWDLHTDQVQYIPYGLELAEEPLGFNSRLLAATEQYVWIWANTGHLYQADLEAGTCRIVAEGITQHPATAVNHDESRLAITNLSQVLLLTPGQEQIHTIDLPDVTAGSVCFYGDELLVLCDDGYLYRYDPSGALLSQVSLSLTNSFNLSGNTGPADPSRINWRFTEDGKLILNAFGAGNIIDCESWRCIGFVPNFVLYQPEENTLICQTDSTLLAYHRYTLPELLALAEEQLQKYQLSTEEKLAFGID